MQEPVLSLGFLLLFKSQGAVVAFVVVFRIPHVCSWRHPKDAQNLQPGTKESTSWLSLGWAGVRKPSKTSAGAPCPTNVAPDRGSRQEEFHLPRATGYLAAGTPEPSHLCQQQHPQHSVRSPTSHPPTCTGWRSLELLRLWMCLFMIPQARDLRGKRAHRKNADFAFSYSCESNAPPPESKGHRMSLGPISGRAMSVLLI